MKTKSRFYPILILSLSAQIPAGLPAQAEPTPSQTKGFASRLAVQETFTMNKLGIHLYRAGGSGDWWTTNLTSRAPYSSPRFDCEQYEIEGANGINYTNGFLLFPFMKWTGVNGSFPLTKPYFSYTHHAFSSNECDYNLKNASVEDFAKSTGLQSWANGMNLQAQLQLDHLSADGSAIEASYHVQGRFLSEVLVSGRSELVSRFYLILYGCTTESGRFVSTIEKQNQDKTEDDSTPSLRDRIAELRTQQTERFTQCSLFAGSGIDGSDGARIIGNRAYQGLPDYLFGGRITPELAKNGAFAAAKPEFSQVIIQSGIEALNFVDDDKELQYQVPRTGVSIDPVSSETATRAVEQFISWLKGDYLDFIDQLNARNPGPSERNAAVRAFALQNQGKILGWLNTLDHTLQSLPLMEKMSVLMNINQSYAKVRDIEIQAKISEGALDRIVQQNAD